MLLKQFLEQYEFKHLLNEEGGSLFRDLLQVQIKQNY